MRSLGPSSGRGLWDGSRVASEDTQSWDESNYSEESVNLGSVWRRFGVSFFFKKK